MKRLDAGGDSLQFSLWGLSEKEMLKEYPADRERKSKELPVSGHFSIYIHIIIYSIHIYIYIHIYIIIYIYTHAYTYTHYDYVRLKMADLRNINVISPVAWDPKWPTCPRGSGHPRHCTFEDICKTSHSHLVTSSSWNTCFKRPLSPNASGEVFLTKVDAVSHWVAVKHCTCCSCTDK